MPRKQTRGERAIRWIEVYCLVPSGLDRGQHVRLTPAQRDIVREIYDKPNGSHGAAPVTGPLTSPYCTSAAPRRCSEVFGPTWLLTSSRSGTASALIFVPC
jgi:hypothetical protein